MTDVSRRKAVQSFLATSATLALSSTSPQSAPAAADQPGGQCVLFPEETEGPFYFDPKLVRSDIAEGRPGAALKIELRIVTYGTCKPLTGARVDLWHADASGTYSGYDHQMGSGERSTVGEKFLRGTQTTDADGRVAFQSIYPGWYPGRTPHIHVKVFVDDKTVATGQMYFADEFSRDVYASNKPYSDRPAADTTNASDGIFSAGAREGGGTLLTASANSGLVSAALVIAIDPTGAAAQKARGARAFSAA